MSKHKSFTLIEVLAAIILIAVALTPLMYILAQSLRLSVKEERLTKVIFLGTRKIEEAAADVSYNFTSSVSQGPEEFSDYSGYKYTVSDDEDPDIKSISTTVWYDENDDNSVDSNEESLTLDTKVSNRS